MCTQATSATLPPEVAGTAAGWRKAIPIIILAGLLAYANSFTKAFVLDDYYWIVENREISDPSAYWWGMGTRYLIALSLLANYQVGGENVLSYHAFNVAVHIGAALVLFGIVHRTLLLDRWGGRYQQSAPWLALVVALLWLVHPLQTQSVTYIVQRCESLMGLFYLLTLYCVLRGARSPSRLPWGWYAGALVCSTLGMGCKEVMATATVVILLYDWVFLAASFGDLLRRRGWLYAAMSVLPGLLVYRELFAGGSGDASAGFGVQGITPLQYALTQPGVILHYLRQALWPTSLCLDYRDWPVARTLSQALVPTLVLVAVGLGTAWALVRRSWLGFVGAWFFLILAPTSSIVPLTDVAEEHRMYLPLAAVVVLVVAAGNGAVNWLCRRLDPAAWVRRAVAGGLAGICVGFLCALTFVRNEDYRSETAIWADTVAKRPGNARARGALGLAYSREGRSDEAIAELNEARRLNPDDLQDLLNLAVAYAADGRLGEAVATAGEAAAVRGRRAAGG
jgi:hypothetical protein